ncbi:type II toxin-antitoxin system PemK/MazF family toxin [bacterium]|nr:type II toxin-antitoxin system PemK/MazF family toxin [bacterium]
MRIKKFHVYAADLNPRYGTEPGKVRPVIVIQTDILNLIHPSTIVCPISTNVHPESDLLRVHLRKGEAGLTKASDILIDQVRAIDNRRFIKELGVISDKNKLKLLDNLQLLILE